MAKPTAPLFSLGASGTIGDAITYAAWKGIDYVRTRVIPANPRTVAQVEMRNIFKTLNSIWLNAPALWRSTWDAFATGKPLLGRNRFIGVNSPLLKGDANLADVEWSEQSGGAPAPTGAAVVNGVGQVEVTATPADLPTGWTLTEIDGVICQDGDAGTPITRTLQRQADATAPYVLTFTGLTGGLTYYGGVYARYTNAAGVVCWSRSKKFTGAPT